MAKPNPCEVAAWKLERPPTGVCFSPAGDLLHAYDGHTIYTWSVPKFAEVRRFAVETTEGSRAGHCRFLAGGGSIVLFASKDNTEAGVHHLTVRNLDSLAIEAEGDIHVEHYGLLTILFNRAESQLLITDSGGTSHFVEFPACIQMRSVKFDANAFATRGAARSAKVFSPDETELWDVCGYDEPSGYREYLAAFDVNTGAAIRRRPPDEGNHIDGLRWTPSRNALLTVEETALCFHDPTSWALLRSVNLAGSLRKGWGRSVPALAFADKGSLVALSCEYNTKVCLADFERAQLSGVFDIGEEFCIRLLAFSPDGRYLAIGSYDVQMEVKVWDVSRIFAP